MRAVSGPVALLLAMAVALLAAAACGGDSFSLPTPGPGGETVIRINMGDNFFSPSAITIRTGQKYILELHNRGKAAHNLRIAGPDLTFDTADDITSELISGGKTGILAVEMTTDGTSSFRSDPQAVEMDGTLTSWTKPLIPSPTPSPTPPPTPSPTPSPEATATAAPQATATPEGSPTAETSPTVEATTTPEATATEAPISTIPPSTP
jgi:flagellin-like protein